MLEDDEFEAVVIGSGFGGTIAALTLTNYFSSKVDPKQPGASKKVCLLERGQWWISHELPYRDEIDRKLETPDLPPNMREFLQDKKEPFNFWAHPDNAEGLISLASKNRILNKTGLYDYRLLRPDVHAVVACGVGGGSLIYSNVTLEPPRSVYKDWPTEHAPKPDGIFPYFEEARQRIGTNKITTLAGLGPKTVKLDKSRVFQEAAHKARATPTAFTIGNPIPTPAAPDLDLGFALDLSITDVGAQPFVDATKSGAVALTKDLKQEILKDSKQQNVCQRQGRCVLGCLPGSRHTLNKMLVARLEAQIAKPATTPPILTVWALTEATQIGRTNDGRYTISCTEYNRDGKPFRSRTLITKVLVLAAGTLGTGELLLKSAGPSFPLSERLGDGFSTDGDLLGFMNLSGKGPVKSVDNTRGPINTCHALFNKGKEFYFSIEDTTIPKMVAPLFATMLELYIEELKRKGLSRFQRLKMAVQLIRRFHWTGLIVALFGFNIPKLQKRITALWNNSDVQDLLGALVKPRDSSQSTPNLDPKMINWMTGILNNLTKDYLFPNASPEERLSKFFIFSCMGMDKANGKLRHRNPEKPEEIDRNHPEEWLWLDWEAEDNHQVFDDIIKGMHQLAHEIDPEGDVHAPTWESKSENALSLFGLLHPLAGIHVHEHKDGPKDRSLVVLHPLGGCRMAETIEGGVVDSYGQVYDPNSNSGLYEKLYVLDGSIVPTALGVNSSLTIAALALRGIKNLVEQLEDDYAKETGIPTSASIKGSDYWP